MSIGRLKLRVARSALAVLACMAAVGASASAAAAPGKDIRAFKGKIKGERNSLVFFTIVPPDDPFPGEPPRLVDDIHVFGAPCAVHGAGDINFSGFGPWSHVNKEFSAYQDYTGGRGGNHYEFRGRIRHRRARGALDFHEEFDKVTTCDTGELRWRAREIS